jgi:hypothetical protein
MPGTGLLLSRPNWSSLLQGNRKFHLIALVVTAAIALPAYLLAPGIVTGLLLTLVLLAIAWIAIDEWRHFQSVSRAYEMAMQAANGLHKPRHSMSGGGYCKYLVITRIFCPIPTPGCVWCTPTMSLLTIAQSLSI